jgi:hypothetical protein
MCIYIIRSSSTAVSIGKKLKTGLGLNLLLSLNREGGAGFLRLLASLI